MQGNFFLGVRYFFDGVNYMRRPGVRRYVALPILFNMILVGAASLWGVRLINEWTGALAGWLPQWLAWLYWVLMPLLVLTLVLALAYFFSTILMMLMAPINGLLSEKVDRLQGAQLPPESLWSLTKRTFWRELVKLGYLLPRYVLLLILGFIPIIQLGVPFLWMLVTCWVMALQYIDYSFDNRQLPFEQTKKALHQDRLTVLGFGAVVALLFTIPVLNWFVMPAAIIGATLMNKPNDLTRVVQDK